MQISEPPADDGRVARRQRRVRAAIVAAAGDVMARKGVDATTMLEIAQGAEVAAGTIYNYFRSKEELALAVLEEMMDSLARRIEVTTNAFADPAEVYAYGIRTVLRVATENPNWRQMLHRNEVVADATYRMMGPFAIRDLRLAVAAGRMSCADPALTWQMASTVLMGASLAIVTGRLPAASKSHVIEGLLCMTGLPPDTAKDLATRDMGTREGTARA